MPTGLNDGICPKCNATEIYTTDNDTYKIVPHKFGSVGSFAEFIDRVAGLPSPVVDNYVCGNCGYAELYVRPSSIEKVKKSWNLLPPPGYPR